MTAITITQRAGQWQIHREGCPDARTETTGWDVDDWADLVDQAFDGDETAANAARIMPCVAESLGAA